MPLSWHLGTPESAFARAAELGVPLFLYWGVSWCPPCNRIRVGAFGRADLKALEGQFIAVNIDGDATGAQQLAERFQVRSYPTLIVYRADGAEMTRLPCELDAARFVEFFTLALNARRTVAESFDAALGGEHWLSDPEWRLLGFYSWDTDEGRVLKERDFGASLSTLAALCPVPEAALRLEWHALHAAALARKGGVDQRAAVRRLEETLSDATAVRAQLDIVINLAVDLVRFLTVPQSATRLSLAQAWSSALEWLEGDDSLSLADRLSALRTRVRLSRLGNPIADLDQVVRLRVTCASALANSHAMRHHVMHIAAGVLADAGLLDEAEQLLQNELVRSHAPFFFMHNLAAIANKRGDTASAVGWYERAWDSAIGPATRMQWGATYLQGLIDFAPHEAPRIDSFAGRMLQEIVGLDDAYCQRNRTQLARIDRKLAVWDGSSAHASALRQAARTAGQPETRSA